MSIDYELLITLVVTVIVAIIGWFLVHFLSAKRERGAKRRDLVIQYLITAWRRLERVAHRDEYLDAEIENAIADIQLFGTEEQIILAHNVAKELATQGGTDVSRLLEMLRQSLRRELELDESTSKIMHLRISMKKENEL